MPEQAAPLRVGGSGVPSMLPEYRTIAFGLAITPSVSVVIPAKNEALNLGQRSQPTRLSLECAAGRDCRIDMDAQASRSKSTHRRKMHWILSRLPVKGTRMLFRKKTYGQFFFATTMNDAVVRDNQNRKGKLCPDRLANDNGHSGEYWMLL